MNGEYYIRPNFTLKSLKLKVRAKLNLSLNVFPNVYKGYHRIDSVVTSVDIFDVVTVEKRKDSKIRVETAGMDLEEEENVAYKVADELRSSFGNAGGVNITIEKGIPPRAGMGGSSADGAAVVYAYIRLFGLPGERVRLHASQIGSDIAYMSVGGLARMTGFGERFMAFPNPYQYTVILIPCISGNDTAYVYDAYDRISDPIPHANNTKLLEAYMDGKLKSAIPLMTNSLLTPALRSNPNLDALYKSLLPILPNVHMTGSGSMLYTICEQNVRMQRLALLHSYGIETIETETSRSGIEILDKTY